MLELEDLDELDLLLDALDLLLDELDLLFVEDELLVLELLDFDVDDLLEVELLEVDLEVELLEVDLLEEVVLVADFDEELSLVLVSSTLPSTSFLLESEAEEASLEELSFSMISSAAISSSDDSVCSDELHPPRIPALRQSVTAMAVIFFDVFTRDPFAVFVKGDLIFYFQP